MPKNKDPNLRNSFVEVTIDEYAVFFRWLRRPTTMNGINIHPIIATSGGRDNVDSEQWIEYGPDKTLVIRLKLAAGDQRTRCFIDPNFLSLYHEEIGYEPREPTDETEQAPGRPGAGIADLSAARERAHRRGRR